MDTETESGALAHEPMDYYPDGAATSVQAPDVDPAVIELNRRLYVARERVTIPETGNDVTEDALAACIALSHEHNPQRFGRVVDPNIARILMGWPATEDIP